MVTEVQDKVSFMRALFEDIADSYDFLNRLLSFGRDRGWRRHAASKCQACPGELVLDVATGTGELALEIAKTGRKVIAIDISPRMLCQARRKGSAAVAFALAQAESLPFPGNVFACATMSFALRNVADISRTIQEIVRVVKTGGKVIFLEFSQPSNRLFKALYHLYLFHILPRVGGLVSGQKYAYHYLPRSIVEFLTPAELKQMMEANGLRDVRVTPLSWGIVRVYVGTKA